jgi:Cu+-exporting ATPase
MHREISHADGAFHKESQLSLYLLTALVGLLIAADLWPIAAGWLNANFLGDVLPTWPNEFYGYRIALLAAFIGGLRALYGSLDSLFQGKLGADLALALAAIAAILLKESLVAAELVFIGMLGEVLESVTFERAQRAIRKLVEITPRRCWRLRDGQEERILVSELRPGDAVVVKPGGRIPGDGVVRDGRSALDVSALTGESLPVDKGPGDEVLAGSLNQFGALTIAIERVGEHTVLGRVIEMTSRALKDKAPLERTADRLARYFLPAVLGTATLTFLVGFLAFWAGWFRAEPLAMGDALRRATYPALSVLVVACPCALILATPATVIAALGRLAGTGIVLKGGSALERLAHVNAFVFDKTGTLTEGRLELGDLAVLAEGMTTSDLLRVAATAEQQSEHLIAHLILDEARARDLEPEPLEEFQAHPGTGVRARTAGATLLVGNARLLEEEGVSLPPEAGELLDRLDAAGQTALLVARDGQVLGAVGVRDRVRPEADAVLTDLRALGIGHIAMLTGDREPVARNVAGALGIAEVYAGLLPEEKAEFVARWQKDRQVAMVGDGINDAPALARANVGLAVGGSAADIAAEAGDIVLTIADAGTSTATPQAAEHPTHSPLASLPMLLRLSREAVRVIRQNILIFAFGVNLLGVLITAWLWPIFAPAGWYRHGPVVAVIYHQLGSLAVLLNAMRLLWFERAAGPGWQRWRERAVAFNHWLEARLDLDEGLHWLEHQWKPVSFCLLALLLLGWLALGFTRIEADEVGIPTRFGRALPEDLEPGLYWRWPWPIEEVKRVRPDRTYTVEVGFRAVPGARPMAGSRAWSSQHSEGLRRVPDEAVMITGDGNLVELQGTVRYRVADPRAYLFEVKDPEATVRNTTEGVLRDLVGSRTFADLLTLDRAGFGREALTRLRTRCREVWPEKEVLHIEGLDLHDLHPPRDVVEAYHEVTRAMETRDKLVNQAEAGAVKDLRKAEARKEETIRIAKAERFAKEAGARGRRDEFLARYRARTTLGMAKEWELLRPTVNSVLGGQAPADALRDYRKRRGEALAGQVLVHDFRRYWERLGQSLSGREKVFIDADNVPGRRTLWLGPFQPPRVLLPPPAYPERTPMRRPPEEPEGP